MEAYGGGVRRLGGGGGSISMLAMCDASATVGCARRIPDLYNAPLNTD